MPTRIISLTLLAIACTAAVEEAPIIVVTAERRDSELARAPVSIEVVDADEVRERGGYLNASDWLAELPGVGLWSTGGGLDGGVAAVRLRGLDQKYTQFLVDGIPQSDQSTLDGSVRLPLYQPVGLSRIELLKGSQSGLYGSGAVGGVVNQLTARPTAEARLDVDVTAGSFETVSGRATATGPLAERVGFAVSVEGLQSEGYSAQTGSPDGDPAGFEDDRIERHGGRARVEFRPTDGTMLYAGGAVTRNRQDYDGTGPDDAASHNQYEQWQVSGGGRITGQGPWESALDLSYQEALNTSYFASPDPGTYAASTWYGSWSVASVVADTTRIGLGIDGRRESAETQYGPTSPASLDAAVDQFGFYGNVGVESGRWNLSATARVDQHEEFGLAPTGRLAAAWFALPDTLKLRGSLANGFRAPILYQLYHFEPGFPPFFPDSVGNPELDPESSLSYEAGVDWTPRPGIELSATAFKTTIEDQIVFESGAIPTPSTYVNNDGTTQSSGIEGGVGLEQRLVASTTVRVDGVYTWLQTEDPDGDEVPFAPEHAGSLRLTVGEDTTSGWRFWQSAALRRSTGYYANIDGQDHLPGATLVQATLGASWNERWEVALRVDNLFDETYVPNKSAAFGQIYASAPRSYWLTASGRF